MLDQVEQQKITTLDKFCDKLEVKQMAKLILRESSYNGLKNVEKAKMVTSQEHDMYVKEANSRIYKRHLEYMKAAKEAEKYFCKQAYILE